MAQISLRDVSKIYKDKKTGDLRKAVDNITLGIENKEFLVLVGPSGCGKSTTLRMIAGLEEITSGKIWIGDRLVNDVPAKDRDIAMVFQNYALYPHMKVFENMAFGLRVRKEAQKEIDRRVNEAAEILGIKQYFRKFPKDLSGGERQRVALGRAIVRKPAAFLLDEPLSNLDAKLRDQMRVEIHKLRMRLQTTFIYVTHDQVEAMTLGDRIAVMSNSKDPIDPKKENLRFPQGKIQQCADPITIYDHPANKFVAAFVGSPMMNFLDGRIIKKDRKYYFDEGKICAKIVDAMYGKLAAYEGKEVTFGIRAEDIYDKLFVSQPTSENIVKAVCEVIEPLGPAVLLYLNTGRHTFIARVGSYNRPQMNKEMDIVFDMNKAHFFDKDTEQTII